MVPVLMFVWALIKCNAIAVVKMGAYIHGVLIYFLWVPIIPIYVVVS